MLRQDKVQDAVADALYDLGAAYDETEVSQIAGPTLEDSGERFRLAIEALAAACLRTRSFELQPFVDAMAALPMTYDELFSLYIGKNVLNGFRQNNGYKSGEYRKLWQGREDNEHLIEVLEGWRSRRAAAPRALFPGQRYDLDNTRLQRHDDSNCTVRSAEIIRTSWQTRWQPELIGTLVFLIHQAKCCSLKIDGPWSGNHRPRR